MTHGAVETPPLLSEAVKGARLSASGQEAQLGHEAGNARAELEAALPCSNRLGGDPGEEEAWITAIGETDQGVSRERET